MVRYCFLWQNPHVKKKTFRGIVCDGNEISLVEMLDNVCSFMTIVVMAN
jgi:hypothetical protein